MPYPNTFYPNYPNYPTYPQSYPTYPQAQQIQSDGLVPVQSEEMAKTYPVALGKSVIFKNENEPYMYTKTVPSSPFGTPIFERYKLVREESPTEPAQNAQTAPMTDNTENETMIALKSRIDEINKDLDSVKNRLKELEGFGA